MRWDASAYCGHDTLHRKPLQRLLRCIFPTAPRACCCCCSLGTVRRQERQDRTTTPIELHIAPCSHRKIPEMPPRLRVKATTAHAIVHHLAPRYAPCLRRSISAVTTAPSHESVKVPCRSNGLITVE